MKRFFLAAVLALAAFPALAGEKTVTLSVDNMTCALCPLTVKKAITGIDGVISADVSDVTNTAVVVYDDAKADVDRIAQAATDAGYPAKRKD